MLQNDKFQGIQQIGNVERVELKTPMEYVQTAQVDIFLTVIEKNV